MRASFQGGRGGGGARGEGRGISGAVFSSVCLLLRFVLLFIPLQSFDYLALLNINTQVIPGALATRESRIRLFFSFLAKDGKGWEQGDRGERKEKGTQSLNVDLLKTVSVGGK